MTHPTLHARSTPDKIAYQMAGSGDAITYRQLDERSSQAAHLFRALSLKAGDHIALLMENCLDFMVVCWAAQRSGLYYTAISRYLTTEEIVYIVADCDARVLVTTPKCLPAVASLHGREGAPAFFVTGKATPGLQSWDDETRKQPTTPIADEKSGLDMLYSSGTTGRPKGVRRWLPGRRSWTRS